MALDDYDPEAVEGTTLCIHDPQTAYDQALKQIYEWYLEYYRRKLDPPMPRALIAQFRALAEDEDDFREGVEIAISLAANDADEPSRAVVAFQALRVVGIIARFLG